MPKQLTNRAADNWRPLLAIADTIGGDCPDKARRAALALTPHVEVTSVEQLLTNIRNIRNDYTQRGIDRISSKELCEELSKIKDGHVLTQDWLAAMLRPFDIRPHTIARYVPESRNTATSP